MIGERRRTGSPEAVTVITLTSDFGLRDPFVGVMKGVILSTNRQVYLVDLTHDIAPQDILEGALALEAAVDFFPSGTIHLAVVDPGVGSRRRALAVAARDQRFVGPDNGLFTFVFEEPGWTAVALEVSAARLPEVSRTFHGRDLFAPAAAALSRGTPLEHLGPPVTDPVRLPWPSAVSEGGDLLGEVVHVDRFGNLVTSIRARELEALGPEDSLVVAVEQQEIGGFVRCYADVKPEAIGAILGSTDRLEIFAREGSAQAKTGATRGTRVRVRIR